MSTFPAGGTTGTQDLERFRTLIEAHLGLRFDPDASAPLLTTVLARRLAATEQDGWSYLGRLAAGSPAELSALGEELTVGETYFLRHVEQLQALTEKVIPERLAVHGRAGAVRLLSAGCSSGEEAYSLAIAVHDSGALAATSILAIDVNPAALAKARSGRYTTWSLRSVPDSVRRRWFTSVGQDVQLDQGIRDRVRFQQANLVDDDAALWQPGAFDVVFCRNVLMYFAPAVMAQVIGRIARSLVPGGYLFLGSAETLRGVEPCGLRLCESHGTFYYQRDPEPVSIQVPGLVPGLVPVPRPAPVAARTPPRTPVRQRLDIVLPPPADLDLDRPLGLLRQERFAEALAALDENPDLPPAQDRGPGLLLRAALLTHTGSYPAADAASRRLLELDEFNAAAHALLATCRESEGDVEGAIGHCRTAISRDPGFALAHLQLARLTQRAGDLERSRQEYATAARLLPGETDERILLFGGGFDRETLISLCRTQSAGADVDRVGGQR